jgi:hypothetical protein
MGAVGISDELNNGCYFLGEHALRGYLSWAKLYVDYAAGPKAINKIFAWRTRSQTGQLSTRLFESVHSFDPERVTIG